MREHIHGLRHACRRKNALTVLLVVGIAGACGSRETVRAGRPFLKGAWLAEHGGKGLASPEANAALGRLRALGVEWLALGPEVSMPDIHRPGLEFGSKDGELRGYLARARRAGFRILLLPRIESEAFFEPPFPFRADIQMRSASDLAAFHANYERMIVHYAELAQQSGVEILGIGLEYRKLVTAAPDRWRRIAARAREVFDGKLTYSANWWKEYEEVTFWDALDYIGLGAYFELADRPRASLAEIGEGWIPVRKKLAALARRTGKPILFTETGYPGYADAARYPWKWQFETSRAVDVRHQAACFEAMFQSIAAEPWFAGLFLWRFSTDPSSVEDWDYSPEGKPAEAVIRSWYGERR